MAGVVDGGRRPPRRRCTASPTACTRTDGHLRWDITGLYDEVLVGLGRLAERYPQVESIGIDTWAVDYGAARRRRATCSAEPDRLPRRPHRGGRRRGARRWSPRASCTRSTGCSSCRSTRLPAGRRAARRPRGTDAAHVVLLPDLLAYWLTGELRHRGDQRLDDRAASTSAPVDWSTELLDRLDIPADLFPPLEQPGTVRGTVRPTCASDSGSARRRGHHRRLARHGVGGRRRAGRRATASPTSPAARGRSSASSSTHPCRRRPARAANFTNEGGVDGRTRFLRNVGGLWLLQESMRTWAAEGRPVDLAELARRGRRAARAAGPSIDVDDAGFIAPGRHARADRRRRRRADASPTTRLRLARCILDSLAAAYAAHRRRGVASSPSRPSTSSTSSAAARRTSCSASSPPIAAALPVRRRPGRGDGPRQRPRPGPRPRRRAGDARGAARDRRGQHRVRTHSRARWRHSDERPRRSAEHRDRPLGRPLRRRSRPTRSSAGWPGPRRSTTCAASPSGACPRGVLRLHRRRRRGRAHPRGQLATRSPTHRFRPRVLRGLPDVEIGVDACSARRVAVPARARPDRVHPHRRPAGRARRRPRRRAGRAAVHAVDAEHPLDRGGRARSATAGSGSRSTPGATGAWSRR